MSTLTQPLKERIKFIQETDPDELVNRHLKEVFSLYQELFGEVCTGCPTKIAGYINRIKNHTKSKTMEKQKSNYRLKKGAIIPIPGTSLAYSNENLTDEVALKFLKKNPARKQLFTVLPDNVDELIEGNAKTKELSDYTVAELKELYPDAVGKNKGELIENIQSLEEK